MALMAAVMVAASILPAETRQVILCTADGWESTTGAAQTYERAAPAEPWQPVGTPFEVSLGRSGLAWGRGLHPPGLDGPSKVEGDGKSPAGIFDLRLATGYGPPPPGTRITYRVATPTLRCVDDPASAHYNRLVDEERVDKDWSSAEDIRREDDLYRFLIWVGHNDAPAEPGAGSCIFLHLRAAPEAVTAGCTAFEDEPMRRLLAWLDPEARPVLVQLPSLAARAAAVSWGLPPPP
jgi:L,D-peptidoglycan transpeptidase YkuD (ErfK/YbiS/YcfS/YnhG family)